MRNVKRRHAMDAKPNLRLLIGAVLVGIGIVLLFLWRVVSGWALEFGMLGLLFLVAGALVLRPLGGAKAIDGLLEGKRPGE